ncbi:asparagine--tRNA ligase [Myxococcota bacterium]|nr:asparagine--tRNA ligase [Myxococcota bacterium]MBU1430129.1 asparagine--tRNA ligase [Myxococcota bacterium]MBU1896900.1 asparagine--tRNA ligase [Myxococcota bacterium]
MSWMTINAALNGAEVGARITVKGWVRSRRDSKAGLSFIALSDGTCFATLQIVAAATLPEYDAVVRRLSTGASIEVDGELIESQGKGQSVELRADAVRLVGGVEDPDKYPVAGKRHTHEYLREVAHLRPRTNTYGAITRVRHTLSQAVHRFFHERGFYWIHTPIITGSDCEGAGEMFRVSTLDLANPPRTASGAVDFSKDFFGKETMLTVSGQLNVESFACALSRVYTFGPTFRAENSNTSRHLSEFWMIEPEIAFADLRDDAALAGDFLRSLVKAALDERADDLAFFDQFVEKGLIKRLEALATSTFEAMTYTEAVKILEASGQAFEFPVAWGKELQSEHERYLTEKHVGAPLVVMDYPKEIKAFYMRLNDDERTVAAMDVLVPGVGEIIGGSQREERLEVLDRRLTALGLNHADYGWYRDLRRYGTVPHAGFGLGFERMIMYATGMGNIRDVIPFPRAPKQCWF